MALKYDVFQVDPKPIPSVVPGFDDEVGPATWPPSTSTYIWNSDDGLLVDALITQHEAQRLAAWVEGHHGRLTTIYITHPHADHFLGLPALRATFPDAQAVALADAIPAMEGQVSAGAMQAWGGFFPSQLTSDPIVPAPLSGSSIPIGDAAATLVPVGATDTDHSSVVHVPALRLIVSGDVVYNGVHMWMAGSTPETRANWLRALDVVESLDAATVIAGHRRTDAVDDDAKRQIEESRRYLTDFEDALAASTTAHELIARMTAAHSHLANPYTLWVGAFDQLPA